MKRTRCMDEQIIGIQPSRDRSSSPSARFLRSFSTRRRSRVKMRSRPKKKANWIDAPMKLFMSMSAMYLPRSVFTSVILHPECLVHSSWDRKGRGMTCHPSTIRCDTRAGLAGRCVRDCGCGEGQRRPALGESAQTRTRTRRDRDVHPELREVDGRTTYPAVAELRSGAWRRCAPAGRDHDLIAGSGFPR